ncbi:AMP-binding protein [Erythrobacter sp. WG]|uniref:AMP-binding protein n=1 Tax=Erythrobacter sp. WG TaxID=2985510 RepID=UPI0022710154|nr:AMP-binding protein [Erythrobacter sp. WG]MCX9148190.1 AMP-binding protein [Erythrobacter sp. WG]
MFEGANFGLVLKALAAAIPADRPALVHGERVVAWGAFGALTDRIAAGLAARGLKPGDIAGQMLRNTPEYLLAWFGCVKAGLVPVNVNYHYQRRELADIATRFGMKALFAERDFAGTARAAMPQGAAVIAVGSAEWDSLCAGPLPEGFAVHDDPDALFLTATGGTTGMPKAVMWPMRAAWAAFNIGVWTRPPGTPPLMARSLAEQVAEAVRIAPGHPANTSPLLLLSPLMHGAGLFSALIHLLKGGTLALLPAPKFDADCALDEVRRLGARSLFIVGDAFALPLAERLDARGDGAEALASLRTVASSGAVFSPALKARLLAHAPGLTIIDALGSSESSGTGVVLTTAAGSSGGGRFQPIPGPGREVRLFDENLREIPPGTPGVGIVARTGPLPLGYLGEDEKNAATFPVIDGKRWLMTGDRARWAADGSLEFIGRDNMCINTGGEKVFPEEVEAVLMEHPAVRDVRVVSLPDPRFGRKVVAVVQPRIPPEGAAEGSLADALDAHARAGLAAYKVPRRYVLTESALRLNNGKPDYRTAQAIVDAAGDAVNR